MKKLNLIKAAIDFAFANYAAGNVELAEKSIAAFKAAGGADADLEVWNNQVKQSVTGFKQFARQKLPSEVLPAAKVEGEEAPAAPASNATAAANVPPAEKAA